MGYTATSLSLSLLTCADAGCALLLVAFAFWRNLKRDVIYSSAMCQCSPTYMCICISLCMCVYLCMDLPGDQSFCSPGIGGGSDERAVDRIDERMDAAGSLVCRTFFIRSFELILSVCSQSFSRRHTGAYIRIYLLTYGRYEHLRTCPARLNVVATPSECTLALLISAPSVCGGIPSRVKSCQNTYVSMFTGM